MKAMGIDPSTKATAHSVFVGNQSENQLVNYGVERRYSPSERKEGMETADRIFSIYHSIKEIIKSEKPDIVYIEDSFLGQTNNVLVLKWLCRLQGFLMELCMSMGIKYRLVMPSEWRAGLGIPTGKNVSRKEEKEYAVAYVNKKFNKTFTIKDEDVCESICLGQFAIDNCCDT